MCDAYCPAARHERQCGRKILSTPCGRRPQRKTGGAGAPEPAAREGDRRQGAQPQQVHLQEARLLDSRHVELCQHPACGARRHGRHLAETARRQHHAARVRGEVRRETFQQGGVTQESPPRLPLPEGGFRIFEQHAHGVRVGRTQSGGRSGASECGVASVTDDLAHACGPVPPSVENERDHPVPLEAVYVQVYVGRIGPLRVEEAAERQAAAYRTHAGDAEEIADHAPCGRSPRRGCYPLGSAEPGYLPEGEEVPCQPGLRYGRELHFQAPRRRRSPPVPPAVLLSGDCAQSLGALSVALGHEQSAGRAEDVQAGRDFRCPGQGWTAAGEGSVESGPIRHHRAR